MYKIVKGEDKTWTWTGSMDHFHGPGSWTPCHGPGPWTVFFYLYKKVLHQVHGHSKNRNSAKKRFDETLSTNAHD